MKWTTLGCFVLAAAGLVGCSSDSKGDGAGGTLGSATSAAKLTAKSMLLTVSDFPLGWTESQQTAGDPALEAACPASKQDPSDRADSGSFTRGPVLVSESISLYATPSAAATAVDDLGRWVSCLQQYINAGKLDSTDAKASNVSVRPLQIGQFGDKTSAFRVTIDYATRAPGTASVQLEYVDIIEFTKGAVRVDLQMFGDSPPMDVPVFAVLAAKALGKVR